MPTVQEITGINDDMLKQERPLSAVFPEFLKWLVDTVKEASDGNIVYYPGLWSTYTCMYMYTDLGKYIVYIFLVQC